MTTAERARATAASVAAAGAATLVLAKSHHDTEERQQRNQWIGGHEGQTYLPTMIQTCIETLKNRLRRKIELDSKQQRPNTPGQNNISEDPHSIANMNVLQMKNVLPAVCRSPGKALTSAVSAENIQHSLKIHHQNQNKQKKCVEEGLDCTRTILVSPLL